jgi:hypothetical protein
MGKKRRSETYGTNYLRHTFYAESYFVIHRDGKYKTSHADKLQPNDEIVYGETTGGVSRCWAALIARAMNQQRLLLTQGQKDD